MCCSANLIVTSYSPASVGTYSTEQDPSRLSLHVIFASDGPSMAKPRPPVPASTKRFQHSLKLIRKFDYYLLFLL